MPVRAPPIGVGRRRAVAAADSLRSAGAHREPGAVPFSIPLCAPLEADRSL